MANTSRYLLRAEVEQLFADYAWAIDVGDHALLHKVFTHDASYLISTAGGPAFDPIVGPAALQEFLESRAGLRSDERRHAITNVRVAVAADEATALLTVLSISDGEITLRNTGIYRVTLGRSGSSLRFGSMHLQVDVSA